MFCCVCVITGAGTQPRDGLLGEFPTEGFELRALQASQKLLNVRGLGHWPSRDVEAVYLYNWDATWKWWGCSWEERRPFARAVNLSNTCNLLFAGFNRRVQLAGASTGSKKTNGCQKQPSDSARANVPSQHAKILTGKRAGQ